MTRTMTSATRVVVGSLMIAAGAGGLAVLNFQYVPRLGAALKTPGTAVVGSTEATSEKSVKSLPGDNSAPGANAAFAADGAVESDAAPADTLRSDAAPADDAASFGSQATAAAASEQIQTTIAPADAPSLPSLRFEANNKSVGPEMLKLLVPISNYVRTHFGLMIVLVGHGDDASNPATYMRVGTQRAQSVMRGLIDQDVSSSRIGIAQPKVVNGVLQVGNVPPGTVEVTIKSRFAKQENGSSEKGNSNAR